MNTSVPVALLWLNMAVPVSLARKNQKQDSHRLFVKTVLADDYDSVGVYRRNTSGSGGSFTI